MASTSFLTWMVCILTCCVMTQACRHVKREIAMSNKEIGSEIYGILAGEREDIVISPISLHSMLSLLYYGSSGQTKLSLQQRLKLPEQNEVAYGYRSLFEYAKQRKNASLTLANKIYAPDRLKLVNQFETDAMTYFNSAIETISFEDPVAAAQKMNEWLTHVTHVGFGDIISPPQLNAMTGLFFFNYLHFYGGWLNTFTYLKEEQPFHQSKTTSVQCKMMTVTGNFEYHSSTDPNMQYSYVRIPYTDNTLSLVIVLPGGKTELADLERMIMMHRSLLNLPKQRRNMYLTIPPFKIEQKISFNSILKQINLGDIFNHTSIPKIISNEGDTHVGDIFQKVLFEVHRYGSHSTAVNADSFGDQKGHKLGTENPDYMSFVADHPFLFFLEANDGGETYVLLQGRVSSPRF